MNKKALSPIFATLIILAVVTVLFVPVFIWATGLTSSNQNSWQESATTATERVVIEEVGFGKTTIYGQEFDSCTIYVRNIGETAVTINDVLLTEPNGKIHTYEKIEFPRPPAPAPTYAPPVPHELTAINPGSTFNPESITADLPPVTKGNLIELRIPRLDCDFSAIEIVSGQTYTVQVFTTRGVGDSYQVVAP